MTPADLVGDLAIAPVHLPEDAATIHGWVDHDRARFWGMQGSTVDEVVAAYAEIERSAHHEAFLGHRNGRPAFLVERYDPRRDVIAEHYEVERGDVGMHFLVAPPTRRVAGFTESVLRTIMDWLFSDPRTRRVVVEPDIRNTNVHRLNAAVGFIPSARIHLPDKDALLSFCTRGQYRSGRARGDSHG